MCDTCGCNVTDGNRHLIEDDGPHAHTADGRAAVTVLQSLLHENDHQAAHNRAHFDDHGVLAVNLMSSPGSGKTSLIKALLPDSTVEIDVAGGTTRELTEYHWTSPAGDELVITDMPGLNETAGGQDLMAREEALRAHIVIYLVDGDLTRSQAEELKELLALDKPCILALNKIDRLNEEQLAQVTSALQAKVDVLGKAEVVTISTGGRQTVIRALHDGSEEVTERQLPPIMEPLQLALQRTIDNHSNTLEQLRDSSVFVLVSRQLDSALQAHRSEQAEQLVHSYARKAVVGAIAAIAPGTDILIQGYLATQMVRELSSLYGVPVRKVDMDLLLKLIQKHVRTHATVLLAIAGNGLKAFPGAGTLAGGVLHAVAYGFLFESLGKSVAASLESRGELHPLQVANQFEERFGAQGSYLIDLFHLGEYLAAASKSCSSDPSTWCQKTTS